ncbi:WD repeat-containing protein 90 [Acipenser ruthenus]|uniref:WD repeat-containing protein 90 n=1 Tax=Acipenser ruthenus TaxID=7906 RepID=A0A444TYM1_ACIRT|nr:WD repeat-containing protein 90 [Acipenser ruthenus]
MSKAWQHPYVNVFKHFKIEEWKKSTKEGDVTTFMDKTLKCTVYRIRGPVPASNYILLPKTSTQSLGLTGRYLYLLFKPIPEKHFVVHLDVATEDGQVIRVSFSNLFKEFKSTATWLQFPFLCGAAKGSVYESTARTARQGKDLVGPAPASVRWICLMMDLQYLLSMYLNRRYSHLKSIKLCASMLLKNLFTSDLLIDPGLTFIEAKQAGAVMQGSGPMPREMCFPVPKGGSWHDLYDYIRFPSDGGKMPFDSIQKGQATAGPTHSNVVRELPRNVNLSKPVQDRVSLIQQITSPKPSRSLHDSWQAEALESDRKEDPGASGDSVALLTADDGGIHVFAHRDEEISVHRHKSSMEETLWTKTGTAVVYPCHAVIVSMDIASGQQRFFIGHTDKVSALTFNGNCSLLASAQTGNLSVVRVWNYQKGSCLSLFKTHTHSVSSLSFSYSGGVLCGVGKDNHGKTMVVVWNTLKANKGGEVVVMAKAHTDVDIQTMKIAFFDDTRMVSCGRDNIRLWRVRSGSLRSCPVNLAEYHAVEFTDVAFEQGHFADREPEDRTLFACSKSGHILEIDYMSVSIKNVRRLLPSQQKHSQRREKQTFSTGLGIAINSISISSAFCATGSDDGYLRLWPLDFSTVFLEAEHEGPVSLVNIGPEGAHVLAATSTGNLGYLDVSSRAYSTLMRSHTDTVQGFSIDGIRRNIVTVSLDNSVRLFDFISEDTPCAVAFHPVQQVFACGFSSGLVRVFNIASSSLLAEHKQHRGQVIGLAFSPDGENMYSAGSLGSLALYNSVEEDHHILRVLGNVVARGSERSPEALTVSSDSRSLAFVGPAEYTVTVMDARSLDEVCFAPVATGHLLVTTSSNKILWMNTKSGRLIREIPNVHKHVCSSVSVTDDARFLLTAGDKAVKVWDYHMKHDINFQVFIGHSQPVQQVTFTPDQLGVVTAGDAVYIWDFLANPHEPQESRDPFGCSVCPVQSLIYMCCSVSVGDPELHLSRALLSNGMPREAVPVPSSSSPPCLDISVIEQAGQGFFSLCEEVEGSALGSSSAGAARGSFLRVTVPPSSRERGKPSLQNELDLLGDDVLHEEEEEQEEEREKTLVRPDAYKHFTPRFRTSALAQDAVAPPAGEESLRLKAVIGYNGNGRGNMVWNPDTGLFAYSCGSVVVLEDLHAGSQKHWVGHTEEISTLAVTNDAQTVASASGGSDGTCSLICIWNVKDESRRSTISYHKGAVQAMTYSRDDFFLLSAGDYRDPAIALWSTNSYQLLTSVRLAEPIHDLSFNPASASQLACVGSGGVMFCLIEQQGKDARLKVHKAPVPGELGEVELTALCYSADSILYTGTNSGRVCAWDSHTSRCFMTWEADEGEIGVLLCRGNRVMSGSNTNRIRLWAVAAVQGMRHQSSGDRSSSVLLEHEMLLDGTVVSAAFDDVMDMGIVGTTTGTLWYINWEENTSIRLISGHKNKVNDVAFSPDEGHFATCAQDGSVRVWAAPSMELVVQFQVLNQGCLCMAWSPASPSQEHSDSKRVAAGYSDGTLRVFSILTSEMELKLHPHPVAVTAIQYSADGQVVLSGGKDGLMAVSSPRTGMTIRIISDHKGASISCIQCTKKQYNEFGLEGSEMWLAASSDRRVSIWAADWMKDKCELIDWLSFPAPALDDEESDSLPPSLAAFSPSEPGVVLYVGYGMEREITFYSLHQKRIIRKIALSHWATCLSLSPRGQLLTVGCNERLIKLIKSRNGKFQDFTAHSDVVHVCRFTPSGKLLFTSAYNEILLWEVRGL